jgi:hypothetical protein
VYLTLFVVCGVFLAGGLAASAIVRRPALSAVLAYGVVFALTIGTLILFGIAYSTAPRDPRAFEPTIGWRWVILSPNPFVVLADAAPRSGDEIDDPLSGIREGVRSLRRPPRIFETGPSLEPVELEPVEEEVDPGPVWPTGLAIELALAALGLYVTVARLKIPAKRLAPGERIA